MNTLRYLAANEEATDRLGTALAEILPPGTVVALNGTLGAGKTRLVQAVAAACGIDRRDVLSPTFVLGQHYHGTRTIHHFDVYRLKYEDEFLQLGPEEYFESAGLTFVEWADKFPECLPPDRLEIQIKVSGETSREVVITGLGLTGASVVQKLAARLSD